MAFTAASKIENALDASMSTAYGVIPDLMTGIGLVAGSAIGLYFVVTVLSYMWTGQANQMPFFDLFKRFFFLIIMCTFAFNADIYMSWVKEPVLEIPNDLAKLISGQGQTSATAIDTMMNGNLEVLSKIYHGVKKLKFWDITLALILDVIWSFLIIGVLGTIYVIIAFCYLMIAKVLIHVVLLVGPIFILFSFFPSMREYFTKWVGQLLNYIFLAVIFTAVFALLNTIITDIISQGLKPSDFISQNSNAGGMAVTLFFTYLLFIGVIMAVPTLASSITGGVGISPFGQVAQLVSGAASGGAGLMRMLNKLRGGGGGNALSKGVKAAAGGNKKQG